MAGALIPRDALDRVIRRAAELQAHERDIGEGLTREELLALGKDVGIPARYLQQALLEEQTRSVADAPPQGLVAWLAGPAQLAAQRVVPGDRLVVERGLAQWLENEESLQVRRRFPDSTTWEPRRGAFVSIRRALAPGGRRYLLTRAREVATQVTALEPGFCHVRLSADVGNLRTERLGWAGALTTVGVLTGVGLFAAGFVVPLAVAPAVVAALAAGPIARAYRRDHEAMLTALEQVLDRLEHGEIHPARLVEGPRPSAFARIADEIRKTLEQL